MSRRMREGLSTSAIVREQTCEPEPQCALTGPCRRCRRWSLASSRHTRGQGRQKQRCCKSRLRQSLSSCRKHGAACSPTADLVLVSGQVKGTHLRGDLVLQPNHAPAETSVFASLRQVIWWSMQKHLTHSTMVRSEGATKAALKCAWLQLCATMSALPGASDSCLRCALGQSQKSRTVLVSSSQCCSAA